MDIKIERDYSTHDNHIILTLTDKELDSIMKAGVPKSGFNRLQVLRAITRDMKEAVTRMMRRLSGPTGYAPPIDTININETRSVAVRSTRVMLSDVKEEAGEVPRPSG